MKIVITPRGFAKYGKKELDLFEEKGIIVDYNDTGFAYTPDNLLNRSKDADAIIVGVDIIDKSFIDSCPRLKIICKFGVGTDNIDVDYAQKCGITVERTIGSNSNAVAEHVMALMFSEAKNIVENVNDVKSGKWLKPTGQELTGKTLGIIGFGAIGHQLARMASGIGMKIFTYDIFEIADEHLSMYNIQQVSLEQIYELSDYISLHLPLTESTKNMISTSAFKKMKLSSCLINTARGGIVDEAALYKALVEGEIRSACFDVFSTEPPATGEQLLLLNNFKLTAHIGARTVESETRTCEMSAQKILRGLNLM